MSVIATRYSRANDTVRWSIDSGSIGKQGGCTPGNLPRWILFPICAPSFNVFPDHFDAASPANLDNHAGKAYYKWRFCRMAPCVTPRLRRTYRRGRCIPPVEKCLTYVKLSNEDRSTALRIMSFLKRALPAITNLAEMKFRRQIDCSLSMR